MYRDDLAAAHARMEQLQRELASASSQGNQDRQRIAQLTAQLDAARDAIARMGVHQAAFAPPQYIYPSRSSTVLVLGILSLVVCSILGPIAWSMGNEELRRIDLGQTPGMTRGSATAGRVCGIVATVLMIISVGVVAIALAAAPH